MPVDVLSVWFFPREKTAQLNIKVPRVLALDNVCSVGVRALLFNPAA